MRFDLPPEPLAQEAMNNHEVLTGLLGSKVIGGEEGKEARNRILKHRAYERTITGDLVEETNTDLDTDLHPLRMAVPISEALHLAVSKANKAGVELKRTITDKSFDLEEER